MKEDCFHVLGLLRDGDDEVDTSLITQGQLKSVRHLGVIGEYKVEEWHKAESSLRQARMQKEHVRQRKMGTEKG